ncbi:hypothetical protein BYT27DRAFT_7197343 [Phlegmacium glaucopus]|nr:hypothetical protein BYT27DRAFT_7197343 [Phlegmacium glaucopus]
MTLAMKFILSLTNDKRTVRQYDYTVVTALLGITLSIAGGLLCAARLRNFFLFSILRPCSSGHFAFGSPFFVVFECFLFSPQLVLKDGPASSRHLTLSWI